MDSTSDLLIAAPRPALPARKPLAIALLVLTTLLWGGSFIFNKIGLRDLPPVVFLTWRYGLAALVMGVVAAPRLRHIRRDLLRRGMLVGLALAGANLTFVYAIAGTTVSRAGFLVNLFVLFIPLLGYLFWRQRVGRPVLLGVGLCTLGLVLLAGGGEAGFNRGDFFSVVSALFIALHILAVSQLLGEVDVFAVTFVQFVTVAVVGSLGLLIPHGTSQFTPAALLALGYCVVFPTVICFTLQNAYQRYVTPAQAGLIYTLDPVWVLIGGMLFLGERLHFYEWVGCGVIFFAVLWPLSLRFLREKRSA